MAFGDINLSFTAPHEDGAGGGKCMYYVIKSKADTDFSAWTDPAASVYVQTWAPQAPGASESLNLEDFTQGTTYYFAIKAYDEYGNESPLSNTASVEPRTLSAGDVVINEIAWKGSKDYGPGDPATDEYIELFNTTAGPIDLAGWAMNFAGGTTVSFEEGTGDAYVGSISDSVIGAHGYFLIENDSDSTNVAPNITDAGMDIADGGQNLYLWASSEYGSLLIDYVSCGSGWYAGTDAPDRNTMERIWPGNDSNETTNWADYSVDDTFGDYWHNQITTQYIYGTPGNPNSVLNEPPEARITVDPVPTWVQGTWAVSYRLRDADGDSCDIDAEFSTDGSTWVDASRSGTEGDPLTGLPTNTDGVSWTDYTFVWNTDAPADLNNDEDATVYFRIRPYNFAGGTVNFMGDTDAAPGTVFGVDNKGPSTPVPSIIDVAADGMTVFLSSESTDGGIGLNTDPYYFECTTDGAFDRTWGDQTHDAAGLSENTQYAFRSRARDAMPIPNLSDWSSETSRYTLLNPPADGELFLEAINWNQMSMAVAPPPNPAIGSTAWQFLTGDTNPGGANSSGWQTDPNYDRIDEDLLPNRQYGWKVRYRNAEGVNTEPNPNEQLKYTLAQPPSNFNNSTTVYVTCDHSFSTCTENPTFIFTNEDGFGTPNPVEYFEWTWDTDASTDPTGSSQFWTTGFLTQTATHEDVGWYLHLKSYNPDSAGHPTLYHMGPFCYMPVPGDGDLVINEIAWMGTAASSNDEWIELYNTTDAPLYLGGCKIYGGPTGAIEVIEIGGTVAASGYYLVERTNDNPVSDFNADTYGTFGGSGLANDGEWLLLKNADGDTVDSVDCSGGWFAGCTGYYYRTMERFDPAVSGSSSANWHPHNFSTDGVGKDADNNEIYGTPRAANSTPWTNAAPTTLAAYITGVPEMMESGQEYEISCTFSDDNGFQDFGDCELLLDNGDHDIRMPTDSPYLTGEVRSVYCSEGGSYLISPGAGNAQYQVTVTSGTALDTGGSSEGSVTVKWTFTPDWDWTESTDILVTVNACDADMECTGSFTADTHPAFYFDATNPNIIGITSDSTHVVDGVVRSPAAGTAFVTFTVTETGSEFDEGGGLTLHYLSNGDIGSGAIAMNQNGTSSPWTFTSASSIPVQNATQDQIITFWATGSDDMGNILTSSLSNPSYLSDDTAYFFVDVVGYGDVVINEIAWMGTDGGGSSDEWVELYNNSNVTVNLNGWQFYDGNTLTFGSGDTIAPKGYFLIENDQATTSVTGDKLWATLSLHDDGELIYLKDASGTQIDRANNSGTWFAGLNNPDYTMERRSPEIDGVEPSNWQTFAYPCAWATATDAGNSLIRGTPRAENSCYVGIDDTGPYFEGYYFYTKTKGYREETNPTSPTQWGDHLTPHIKISTGDTGVGLAPIGAPVWNDFQTRGYWQMDNNGGDSSGRGNTGSISGSGSYVPTGRFFYALDLNGGYFNVPEVSAMDGFNQFSIEAWIYPDWDQASGIQTIIGKNSSYYFLIDWNEQTVGMKVALNTITSGWTKAAWCDAGFLNPAAWNHVAFTWQSGARGNIFIDTVEVTTTGTSANAYGSLVDNSNAVQVGAYNGSNTFKGKMDSVRISEKVRTTSEFTTQNNASPFRYRRDANDGGWSAYSDYAAYQQWGGIRGTSQDFSGAWNAATYAGNNWTVAGGVMNEASNSTAWTLHDNLLLNNMYVTARVKTGAADDGAVGIIFRKSIYVDNCYVFGIRPETSQCILFQGKLDSFDWDNVDWSASTGIWFYAGKKLEKDTWYDLEVAAVENNIRCYIDNEPVILALDAGAWYNGYAGLYSWDNAAASFDDFISNPIVNGRITGWEGDTDAQGATLSWARFDQRDAVNNQVQMLAFDLKNNMAWSDIFTVRTDPDKPAPWENLANLNVDGEWVTETVDSTTPSVRLQITDDETGLKAKRRYNDPDRDTILYYPFDESWVTQGCGDYSRYLVYGYGPNTDATGFSNHTVAENWNSPNNTFGWCMYFNGTDDFVWAGSRWTPGGYTGQWYPHLDFNGQTGVTVECWFNSETTGAGAAWKRIVSQSKYDSGMYGCFELSLDDDSHLRVGLNTTSGWIWIESTSQISADTWHNGAFTYDGATIKLFLDGVLESQTAVTGTIAVSASTWGETTDHWPIVVGASLWPGQTDNSAPGGYQAPWEGRIDDLRISRVARSEEEIKLRYPTQDYNAIWSYSTTAGASWSNWTYAQTSGWTDTTTTAQWVTVNDIPFNNFSLTDNLIKFATMDMAGNVSVSDPQTVVIDTASVIDIVINEVAFSAQTDWVELYVKSGASGVNIQNWYLQDYDSSTTLFTTETITVHTGDYVVVHFEDGVDETDATGMGANGYWDIYIGSSHNLTATDEGLALVSAGGRIRDAVFWANDDGTGESERTDFNNIAPGQWIPSYAADVDAFEDAAWTDSDLIDATDSICRDGVSTDTNTKSDWHECDNPNPGEDNEPADIVGILSWEEDTWAAHATSIPSGTWHNQTVVTFSWTDPLSISNDTFYYEIDFSAQTDSIGTDDAKTGAPYLEGVDLTALEYEGTYYFHCASYTGWGKKGPERLYRIRYDLTPPGPVADLASSSHTVGTWNDTTDHIKLTWTDAADDASNVRSGHDYDVSGVLGYYYRINSEASYLPETTDSFVSFGDQSCVIEAGDGTWYFHIRSIDNAGNFDDAAVTVGPFKIDLPATAGKFLRVNYVQYVPEYKTASAAASAGDCMLYELPGGKHLLIDGGSSWSSTWLNPPLRTLLDDKLGGAGETLDYMVLAIPNDNSGAGLTDVLERYDVLNYYETSKWNQLTSTWYGNLWTALNSEGSDIYYFVAEFNAHTAGLQLSPAAGAEIGPGWDDDVDARLVTAWNNVSDANRRSAMIRTAVGSSSFLCGGDSVGSQTSSSDGTGTPDSIYYPEYYARTYRPNDIDVDIFAVNQNGSDTYGSNGITFIKRVSPRFGIVQLGYNSSQTNPKEEVMDRLNDAGAIVYRNDLDGTVIVKSDNRGNYDITRERAWANYTDTPGASSNSDLVNPPPGLPTELYIDNTTSSSITLTWADAFGEQTGDISYDIYRADTTGGWGGAGTDANPRVAATGIYKKIGSTGAGMTSFTDNGLTGNFASQPFYYRVVAKKTYTDAGFSVTYERRYSNETVATAGEARDTIAPEKVINLYLGEGDTIGDYEFAFTAPHENADAGGRCRYYVFKYQDSSFTAWTDPGLSTYVQCWYPESPGTSENLNLEGFTEDTTYYFAVKAFDEYGNASPMSDVIAGKPRPLRAGDVVVNEIAWMGIKDGAGFAGPYHEYIELFNTTEKPINLAGWGMNWYEDSDVTVYFTVSSLTALGGSSSLNNTRIDGQGFFLIEHDQSSTNSFGDIIHNKLRLPDSGRDLYLWAGSPYDYMVIDTVPHYGSGWYAGTDIGNFNSMERIVPYGESDEITNWADYSEDSTLGDYYNEARTDDTVIYGTPGAQNSVFVDREKDTDNDGMWDVYEKKQWDEDPNHRLDYEDGDANDATGPIYHQGPMDDADGDGFTNLQEFWLRTNPYDSTNLLRLESIRMVTGGVPPSIRPQLIWESWDRVNFDLQYFVDGYIQPLFDILYVDWPAAAQAGGAFPNNDWFNQTGTWSVLASNIYASWDSVTTTWEDNLLGSLGEGDIRFYRVSLHGMHLEGDLNNYLDVRQPGATYKGSDRRVSVVTPQIFLIQKQILNDPDGKMLGMPGAAISGIEGQ